MYLSQVRRNGLLGLIGYLVFAAGYLQLMIPPYIAAFVLPSIAETNPGYCSAAHRKEQPPVAYAPAT